MKTYAAIRGQLDELLALAEQADLAAVRAEAVSGWTVGQQLEHLLLSDQTILEGFDAFLDGTSTSEGGGPTAIGRLILMLGFIPRGKGKAPRRVLPGALDPGGVVTGFVEVKRRFEELEPRLGELEASRATNRHPVLGAFDFRQWLRFIQIHHRHHTKIIEDIRQTAG